MDIIQQRFKKLIDRPCWNVQTDGDWLSFEFGTPKLEIFEPRIPKTPASSRLERTLYDRRRVSVKGQWRLTIETCEWVVRSKGKEIGASGIPRRMANAARALWGQKLVNVSFPPRGARTLFSFDLGGELETAPYRHNRSHFQWQLQEPNDFFLSFRADRRYSYDHGSNRNPRWHKLPRLS